MNINYTARHTQITPESEKYCERRIRGIEKVLGYPVEASIILSVEKYRHKAELNIRTKGATLNAEEETSDMPSSLGLAFDNIEKRIKKERDKLRERKRRKGRDVPNESAAPEPEEIEKRIIRSPSFSLKPMAVEEAVMMLEAGKEDVFAFRRFDTEKWAVIFRRKDGHYGLIDPE